MERNNAQITQDLLAFVRSGLWQSDIEGNFFLQKDLDWYSVIPLAKKHQVLGLVADATLRCGLLPEGSGEKAMSAQIVKQVRDVNQRHLDVIAKVVNLLEKQGIMSVLLKGEGLATCYPDGFLRQSGDIDLYVDISNFKVACQILDTICSKGGKHKMSEKHYAVVVDGVEIELHHFTERLCNPFRNRWFQQWSREELHAAMAQSEATTEQAKTIERQSVILPPVEYNIVYTFCHLWNHFEISGIGLRHMCDMAALLHHNVGKIDIKKLRYGIKSSGLIRAWQLTGAFLTKELGLPEGEFPLYSNVSKRKLQGFTDVIISGGEFGQPRRDAFYHKYRTLPRFMAKSMFYVTQFFRALPYCGTGLCWRVLRKFTNKNS